MQGTITIRWEPQKPHQKTGEDRGLNWVGETQLDFLDQPQREGTCRAATFEDALRLCTDGLLDHYEEATEEPDRAGYPDMDSAGGDDAYNRAYRLK